MLKELFNKNFTLLILGSSILGIILPTVIVIGGLAGISISPYKELVTLPISLGLLAGPISAIPISLLMGKFGRKVGFLTGASFAIAGGTLGTVSLIESNFILLNIAHICFGVSIVSFNFIRFAAAEVVNKKIQTTAVSFILGSSLLAAIVSPQIFSNTHDLISNFALAGTYAITVPIAILGAIPIALLNIKMPKLDKGKQSIQKLSKNSINVIKVLKRPQVAIAILCASSVFAIMTYLMTPTPISMINHDFSIAQAGNVVGWHVIAMFAPSFFTGFIIMRFGTLQVIFTGFLLLLVSPIIALIDIQLIHFYVSMLILGVAWNFAFIGATTLLNESLSPEEKPMIQGINDTLISLASAITSLSSGFILAQSSWNTVLIITFPFIGLTILILVFYTLRNRQLA